MKNPIKTAQTTAVSLSAIASLLFSGTHSASAATDTWSSTPSSANWNSPNWTGGNNPPLANDSLIFNTSSQTTLTDDFPALTPFSGITFTGGNSFTVNGANSVLISGAWSNNVGLLNSTSLAQTLGIPLVLDWGYYTIYTPFNGPVALNGGITVNQGGVGYFDSSGNVTSTTLTLDSTTGLINGLEGSGLIFNGSFPTGLATISSGSITTYAGYTSIASGAIGNGNNLSLTASGATGTYTAANNTVNTISAAQAGTNLTTLTVGTGTTLTLGQHGGIYALANSSNPNALTVTGGTLTAGTSSNASIVFATHNSAAGNAPPNVMTVSSVIANNPGGAVNVVKVGNSSMVINGANTYSGGTYILQGQIQAGASATSLGSGPIYIAGGATYLNNIGAGTIANNFFLSPGNGSSLWNGTAVNPGGLVYAFADGNYFYNGVFTLLGDAVTNTGSYPLAAGCRIIGNKDIGALCIFQNQITGNGTLDLTAGPHADLFEFSNNPSNHPANNWKGGLIIEEDVLSPSSARDIIVKLLFNNQIPHGSQAGDLTIYSAASIGSFITGSSAQLDLNGFSNTVNGLYGNSAGGVSANVIIGNTNAASTGNSVLTIGDNNANGNYAGITADTAAHTLGLVKIGTGTQIFSAPLNHHGNTIISNGNVTLNGSVTLPNSPLIAVASGATIDATGISYLVLNPGQTLAGLGSVLSTTMVNGSINPFFGTIGTLTDNDLIFNGGGSYIWNINDATGTAGSDPGWGVLNVPGGLQVNSTSGSPFIINITSLTSADVAGSAAHFNPNVNGSWTILTSGSPISGISGAGQFSIVTSSFSNAPLSAAQWSVGTDVTGQNLVLTYTATPAITTPLVSITNNLGTTATFTVVANGAATPITFNWVQGTSTPLTDGGFTANGTPVSIVSSGHTSTLTLTGVQDGDAGGFTVSVTNAAGASGTSSASLTIIDPPSNLSVSQSLTYTPVSAGSIDLVTSSVSGTLPLSYQWYLNGIAISGATSSNFNIGIAPTNTGNYSVVVSNPAGSATNTFAIGPVSGPANQIVYEDFNYPVQVQGQAAWTGIGVTNIYNQITGVPLAWANSGTATAPATLSQDMRLEAGFENATYSPHGDSYPWPGLAGNSPQELYNNSGSDVRLPLGTGGSITNGTIYFSAVIHVDQGGAIAAVGSDYLCGFGNGTGTTPNISIYIQTPGDDTYIPGIFKNSSTLSALSPGVNGAWSGKAFHRGQIIFAVARAVLKPGSTNDTFDLWLCPAQNSFGVGEGSLPTPDVTGVGSSAPDVGTIDFFYTRDSAQPFSRRFTDVRIGTTWASVTPPSAPTLTLSNIVLSTGVTTAVFKSRNAGNLITTYTWQHNGGPVLTDGPTGTGATISGSDTDTLTITGVTIADLGTYTVNGSNTDPSVDLVVPNGGTLTGSASATLSIPLPTLTSVSTGTSLVLSWPTNFAGYTLIQSSSLNPHNWTTNSNPPYAVVGTNYSVTVGFGSGTKFFRLIH